MGIFYLFKLYLVGHLLPENAKYRRWVTRVCSMAVEVSSWEEIWCGRWKFLWFFYWSTGQSEQRLFYGLWCLLGLWSLIITQSKSKLKSGWNSNEGIFEVAFTWHRRRGRLLCKIRRPRATVLLQGGHMPWPKHDTQPINNVFSGQFWETSCE